MAELTLENRLLKKSVTADGEDLAAVSRWLKWRDIKEATRASAKPKPKAMTRQAREARLALDRKPNGGAYSNQP